MRRWHCCLGPFELEYCHYVRLLFCIMFLLQFFDALYCSSHYACKFDDIEYARCIALCSSSSTLVQFDQQSNVNVHAKAEASATERAHARANRLAAAAL